MTRNFGRFEQLRQLPTGGRGSKYGLHNDDMDFNQRADSSKLFQISLDLLETSSEEEEERRPRGGSRVGRRPNIDRERTLLGNILYRQYFAEDPIYDHTAFRRRYRVSRAVFDRLFDSMGSMDTYFVHKKDCTGLNGLSPYQKMTAAMRMLTLGVAADALDDKIGVAESTAIVCLDRFCKVVMSTFGDEYLRSPTHDDIARVLSQSAKRGFPGMLGSIDCSKWEWKNCPTAYHGQYKGKEKVPTVTLEAICDQSLWIWHAFFGLPGCLNDVNVVEASPLTQKIARGEYPPPVEYVVNGVRRNKPYWLCDSIYPKWPMFIDTIREGISRKHKFFATMQEAARKDIERAFGVLQAMFHIIREPARFASVRDMKMVMNTVIILHNMMVEDRCHNECEDGDEMLEGIIVSSTSLPMWEGLVPAHDASAEAEPGTLAATFKLESLKEEEAEHDLTKRLLVEHLWNHHGDA